MPSGNHLADQGQREYEKRGECPSCHKGSMTPIDFCPNQREDAECEAEFCPVGEECHEQIPAAKCNKCGYITKEVD